MWNFKWNILTITYQDYQHLYYADRIVMETGLHKLNRVCHPLRALDSERRRPAAAPIM